jgi:hypothetical protein
MEETPLVVETLPDDPKVDAVLTPQPQASSILDQEAAVKAAVDGAVKQGLDPADLTLGDFAQGRVPTPPTPKVDVPEKFKKPTGEVDVEKLQASTRQLDEAQKTKEAQIQKSVEDYLAAEKKFRNTPNPQKVAETLQPPIQVTTPPLGQPMVPIQDIRAKLAQDFERDFVGTLSDLTDIIVANKMKPLMQDIEIGRSERLDQQRRANLQAIAAKDPRILDQRVFDAVNAKLEANPELWNLKNPHKAAWLEVKEEMRLGEPTTVQAHPSKAVSPILGGGTPPPPQSSASDINNPDIIRQAISSVNRRDQAQMDALERAVKTFSDRNLR